MRKIILAFVLASGFCSSAFAYTECSGKITSIYAGDGIVWINSDGGPAGYINQSSPDFKTIYAAALTAYNADKSVSLRFAADGVACVQGQPARGDFIGIVVRK